MIAEHFRKLVGSSPEVVARAPGRVNLIGEHTDYNDGFVLPAAIDRYIEFAGRRRADRLVRVYSLDFQDQAEFSLDALEKDTAHSWSNYLRGVSKFLEADGHRLTGADIVFGGDVPREAGLSSSAAVEVAAATFWKKLLKLELDPVYVIKLARRAENEFVGVPCGIMDQFISALGRQDHALFLDCRDLGLSPRAAARYGEDCSLQFRRQARARPVRIRGPAEAVPAGRGPDCEHRAGGEVAARR